LAVYIIVTVMHGHTNVKCLMCIYNINPRWPPLPFETCSSECDEKL